jgi:hypothetical protein
MFMCFCSAVLFTVKLIEESGDATRVAVGFLEKNLRHKRITPINTYLQGGVWVVELQIVTAVERFGRVEVEKASGKVKGFSLLPTQSEYQG